MPELNYTYDHLEQLYEIAGREGLKLCPVCGEERRHPNKPYGRLTLGRTIKVAVVCGNGCNMHAWMWVKLNNTGNLESYQLRS